jgi:hypothetical protein
VLAEGGAETLRGEAERAVERRKRESDLLERFHGALAGGKRLDPADAGDRAAADHAFEAVYRPRLIAAIADPPAFVRLLHDLARDIERIGTVPDGVADLVGAWWASGDPRFQAGAARLTRMIYHPDGPDAEHAKGLPLGAMPDGVPVRLDLAAKLIDAGVPDEVAVKRAGDLETRTADESTTAKPSASGETSGEDDGSTLGGLDAGTTPSDEVSSAQGQILSVRERQEPRLTKVHRNQTERAYRNLVDGWRRSGRTQAADNLERFLDGTGEPLRFSRDEAREFRPIKAAEAESERRFEESTWRCRRAHAPRASWRETVRVRRALAPEGERYRRNPRWPAGQPEVRMDRRRRLKAALRWIGSKVKWWRRLGIAALAAGVFVYVPLVPFAPTCGLDPDHRIRIRAPMSPEYRTVLKKFFDGYEIGYWTSADRSSSLRRPGSPVRETPMATTCIMRT